MPRFTKLPVTIDAMRFTGLSDDQAPDFEGRRPKWLTDALARPRSEPNSIFVRDIELRVQTSEGSMVANPGDWIIRGVEGELYPCKPSVFEATYRPAEA